MDLGAHWPLVNVQTANDGVPVRFLRASMYKRIDPRISASRGTLVVDLRRLGTIGLHPGDHNGDDWLTSRRAFTVQVRPLT